MTPNRLESGLLDELMKPVQAKIARTAKRVDTRVAKILRQLLDSSFLDEGFTVDGWFREADARGRSQRTRFRTVLRKTPKEYLDSCRFEIALRLMEARPDLPFSEVSFAVGYSLEGSFYRAFNRFFGLTPAKARDLLRSQQKTVSELLGDEENVRNEQVRSAVVQCREPSVPSGCTRSVTGQGRSFDRVFFDEVLWDRLCLASPGERREIINCGFRFHTAKAVRELIRRSVEECRDDRFLGVRIAELAVDAVWAIKHELSEFNFRTLRVESLANLGNCQRLAGNLDAADTPFSEAELELHKGDVSTEAEGTFFFLKGHLYTHKRLFPEASKLLARSYQLRSRLKQLWPLAQVVIAQGYCFELQGESGRALQLYDEALDLLSREKGGRSYLIAVVHSRRANACILERELVGAERELRLAEEILEQIDQQSGLCRLLWIRGILAYERGDEGHAEQYVLEAYKNFCAIGETANAALVAIDLALLCMIGFRHREAMDLVAEALPILESLNLPDETLSALNIQRQAIARTTVNLSSLLHIREVLEVRLNAPHWRYPHHRVDEESTLGH